MSESRAKQNRKKNLPVGTDPEEEEAELTSEDSNSIESLNQIFNSLVKIFVIAVFLIAAYYGVKTAYRFGYSVFTEGTAEAAPGRDIEITVLEGMSDRSVGAYLRSQGLIKNSNIFFVQAKIYGYKILPGTYTLNTSQTIYQMLRIMAGFDT